MSKTLDNGQIVLTLDEALERLPDKPEIHTFLNPGFGLLGADWSREEVIALLTKAAKQENKIQESGDSAQGMGHGLVVLDQGRGAIFIEARGPK